MGTQAGVYVRISSDPSGERAGVQRQLAACKELAKNQKWEVVEVYEDDDISAYSGKRRPAYERMLADVASGRISAIVAWHPDRLYRRVRDLLDLITLAEKHSIKIATVSAGSIDLSTPTGRSVAITVATWTGEFESGHKAERVSARAVERVGEGQVASRRSFGYEPFDTGKVNKKTGKPQMGSRIVPEEANAIREAVDMVIAGSSLGSVGLYLDKLDLRTVRGHLWGQDLSSLRRLLTSFKIAAVPSYRGEPIEDVEPLWKPIITREQHEQVRAVLLDDRRRTNGHRAARKSLLSNLITCGICDGPVRSASKEISRTNPTRTPIYRCRYGSHTYIRQHFVDPIVIEATLVELMTGDLVALAPDGRDRTEMVRLRVELDGIAERRADVRALGRDGLISAAEVRADLLALKASEDAAQGALQAITVRWAPAAFVKAQRDLLELADVKVDEESRADGELFMSLDLGRQRSVVRSMVTIKLHPGGTDQRLEIRSVATGELLDTTLFTGRDITWRNPDYPPIWAARSADIL